MKWPIKTNGTTAMQDTQANVIYHLFHKGLAIVYLCAFIPMFFELDVLIGAQGFQPAKDLLQTSYSNQGVLASLLQFPSLFHLLPENITLFLIAALGCIGALGLLVGIQQFWSALIAWFSFLSITTIGGDFYIIIIDLFLAEVGFLTLFSTYFLQYKHYIPNIISLVFKLLNFKLWFSMGVIKFYMPLNEWTNFTFFDTFFQAQPMPTPLAKVFAQAPFFLKVLATLFLFFGEIIAPFFVFGKKQFKLIAGASFVLLSVLIQMNGNYGYFNLLSIVLVLPIFKSSDFGLKDKEQQLHLGSGLLTRALISVHMSVQLIFCLLLFHPKPAYFQNHFNFLHTYLDSDAGPIKNALIYPMKLIAYWRICNPYGVFKGIPKYHGEIRLSGSINGKDWHHYEFKYLPSGSTDYLGYYAPYYPRLDHLMFYETLSQPNSQLNTLNPYYKNTSPWSTALIKQLFEQKPLVNKLLKKNPFDGQHPPMFVKATLYPLHFRRTKHRNWKASKACFEYTYTKNGFFPRNLIPSQIALDHLSN